MRKTVNARYVAFFALSLTIGILVSAAMLYYSATASIVVVSIYILLIVFFSFRGKKFKLSFFMAFVFLLLGFVSFQASFQVISSREIDSVEGKVVGRVSGDSQFHDDYALLTLEDCVFFDGGKDKKLTGKIYVFLGGSAEVEIGDICGFSGILRSRYVFRDRIETFSLRSGIFYDLAEAKLESVTEGGIRFDEKARKYIKIVFDEYMPESGAIAYALLLGDKSDMLSSDLEAFRRTGIIHILAVSGLHIGFVAAVFSLILKKMKIKAAVRLPIVAVPLIFYAYICGFSPSVVRAIVMTALSLAAQAFGRRPDSLTSMSFSALLILSVQPLYLFDAGFLMSFGAVFGIISFSAAAGRFFRFKNIPKFLKKALSALSVSLGAYLGTAGFTAEFYGEISLLSVVFNPLVLPFVTAAFILCLVGLLPGLFHFVLIVPDMILYGVRISASFLSKLPFSAITAASLGLTAAVIALWLLVFGGFVNLPKKIKSVVLLTLAVLFAGVSVFSAALSQEKSSVAVLDSYGNFCVVANDGESNYIVVCDFTNATESSALKKYFTGKIVDSVTVCIGDGIAASPQVLEEFCNFAENIKIRVFGKTLNAAASDFFDKNEIDWFYVPLTGLTNSFAEVRLVYDGAPSAFKIKVGPIILAAAYSKGVRLEKLPELIYDANIFYADGYTAKFVEKTSEAVLLTKYQCESSDIYGLNKYGNFTIVWNSDKITVNMGRR